MAYSSTRTTTGWQVRPSGSSRDSHEPSARMRSGCRLGAPRPVRTRQASAAPLACACREVAAPANNRSASSSTPASRRPSSPAVRVCSLWA